MVAQPSNNIRDSIFVKSYLVGLAAGLVLWPALGPALAAEIGIVLFWGLLLLLLIVGRVSDKAWVRLIVELLPPVALWVQFGLGGVLALLRVRGWQTYGNYDDFTVVLTTIFVVLGSFAYLFGIRLTFGRDNLVSTVDVVDETGRARLLLFVILVIDWSVRIHKNLIGVYINWIAKSNFFTSIERGAINPFYHLQASIGPITIPLLVYLSIYDRWKWLFRALLAIQFLLVFLEGDRSELLFALIVGVASFALLKGIQINRKVVLWSILAIVLFFGVISPVIQEARVQMRRDTRLLVEQRIMIPVRYATVYLPEAADVDTLLDDTLQGSLLLRLGGYSFYAAAIHQSILDQKADLLTEDFFPTLLQLVPRVLYRNKGQRDSNYVLQEHFKVGLAQADALGNPLVDIFGYTYVFGIIGLMFFCGLGFGLVVKYLTRDHTLLGGLVTIGMMPTFLPIGDSFVGYLADLRNALILLFIIFTVDLVYTIISSERKTTSKSVRPVNVP